MTPAAGLVRPEALPLLVAVALIALVAVWAEVRRRRATVAFAGRGADLASVSAGRRRAKVGLAVGALALSVIALAGPYVDVVERTVTQRGVDLVIALDVSQSMAVRDIEPNDRLRAAKQFVQRLGDGLTQSRVSLVLFAGEAIVRYPSTADPAVLGQTLDQITTGFRPGQGSSLRVAIEQSLAAFTEEARQSPRSKAVILVTDGEDTIGAAPDVQALRAANAKLYTVGVGTPSGGPIPTYDRGGRFGGYLTRADGTQVISRLDENALRGLAQLADGKYFRLSGFGTVNELTQELRRLDATSLGETEGGAVPDDRYQILLGAALLLLLASELISDRRAMPLPGWLRRPRQGPRLRLRLGLPRPARAPSAWLLAGAIALGSCGPSVQDADRAYLEGDLARAVELYGVLLRNLPGTPEVNVNLGNAFHRLGQHDDALREYATAEREGTSAVRAVALYQRGNTFYRMGRLEEAREAYKAALRIDPNDRDAKFNIEVIDRLLGVPQPPEEGQPGEGSPPPGQQGQPGESPPGQGEGEPPSDLQTGGEQQATPGSQGPQSSGPPTSSAERSGRTLNEILQEFRSNLTAEQALRLLEALIRDQRGIEQLIEGSQPTGSPSQRRDPTY